MKTSQLFFAVATVSVVWLVIINLYIGASHCSDQSLCGVRLPRAAQGSGQHLLSGQHGRWSCRAHHRSVSAASLILTSSCGDHKCLT